MKKQCCYFSKPLILALFCLIFSQISQAKQPPYATDYGMGPDKWASVWLIENNGGEVELLEETANPEITKDYTLFDVPSAKFNRTGSTTTYQALQTELAIQNETAQTIGQLVYEIEIGAWNQQVSQESKVVEHAFRRMQLKFGREGITKQCYIDFFNHVASAVDNNTLLSGEQGSLLPNPICMELESNKQTANNQTVENDNNAIDTTVPVLELGAVRDVLSQAKQKVLFVDTRETWEWREGHIPGAINIKLRDVKNSLNLVEEADLVIAYCVKDFRGYEAARAFRKLGINAAIMKPYGMRGWVSQGLPVAGSRGLPEDEALALLSKITP